MIDANTHYLRLYEQTCETNDLTEMEQNNQCHIDADNLLATINTSNLLGLFAELGSSIPPSENENKMTQLILCVQQHFLKPNKTTAQQLALAMADYLKSNALDQIELLNT